MEIITKGFPGDDQVMLDSAVLKYFQGPDCTEGEDDYQEITISTRNNGVGNFINVKTEGWSISEPEDLLTLLNDFKSRLGEMFDDE